MHRALIEQHFDRLPPARAAYFAKIVELVERDARLEMRQNIAFLVLEQALFDMPIELTPERVVARLHRFVDANGSALRTAMYSRAFVTGPRTVLRQVGTRFAAEVSHELLDRLRRGEIDEGRAEPVFRFAWPSYRRDDFPYADDEPEDD